MKLPNGKNAVVDARKLREYCLSPNHPRGRHKARVFTAVLGIRQEDAEVLRGALLEAARVIEATAGEADQFGQRYVLDFEMSGPAGKARVRSLWIIRTGEAYPRMTSCFVL
jgi:Domain of unknown function (DUF6883)